MKNITKIAILLLGGVLAFASCRKTTESEEIDWRTELQVVTNDLTFLPGGGTGTATMNESVSKAVSSASWATASVSGSTVTVTVEPLEGKESRYATVTVSSATESLDLPVIQYGEVIAGLNMADISAPYTGTTVSTEVKMNVDLDIAADQDWIHPAYDLENRILTVVVDANPDPATRVGKVTYRAGSVSGAIEVIQNPPYVQASDWTLTSGNPFYDYPDFMLPATLAPETATDSYVLVAVPSASVPEDLEAYVFSTVAPEIRRQILAAVESTGGSFGDYLYTGEQTADLEVPSGDVEVIAVGFADNSYVTGKYQYLDVTVDDVRPPFFKWVGNWSVSRVNANYDTTDIWEITIKDLDEKILNIHGIEGMTNASRYDAEATVDEETGELILMTQNCSQYEDETRGTITVLLSGQYTNVAGKTYYTSSLNRVLFRAALSEDGNSAELNPGSVTSGGAPAYFHDIQFYGRYTNASGGTSAITWKNGATAIPQTIVRVL